MKSVICLMGLSAWLGTAHAGSTFEVIPRTAWGASDTRGKCKPHVIKNISVHHTATGTSDNRRSPQRLRSYQRYHQEDKGWVDVAYHLFIDLDGHIYKARDLECVGDTATNYDPTGHLLVVLEGNFEQQEPSERALRSLVDVLSWGAARFDVPPSRIRGHNDLASTACPGANLSRQIRDESIRKRVEARMKEGRLRLRLLSASRGLERVEQIKNTP